MNDSWVPGFPSSVTKFFDIVFFNSDTMTNRPQHKYIASIYYRIDIDEVKHSRAVFEFMNWLGAIAGIEKFLMKWMTFIFGGFIQYNAAIEIIN